MPLNGTNIHPLSAHAVKLLRALRDEGPRPTQRINPGVVRRFADEHLVELVELPSPYFIHAGGKITHARITEAGIARLDELDATAPKPR